MKSGLWCKFKENEWQNKSNNVTERPILPLIIYHNAMINVGTTSRGNTKLREWAFNKIFAAHKHQH